MGINWRDVWSAIILGETPLVCDVARWLCFLLASESPYVHEFLAVVASDKGTPPEAQLAFDILIMDTILSSAFPRWQGVLYISHHLSSSCHTKRSLHATTQPHISYAARPALCRVSSCLQPPERLCAGVCHTLRGAQHSGVVNVRERTSRTARRFVCRLCVVCRSSLIIHTIIRSSAIFSARLCTC